MTGRKFIESKIFHAWRTAIEVDYASQRINSERSLQAAFWAHLNMSLPKTRRLFIEPTLIVRTPAGNRRITPDIVICNTREVISIIELKYLPRAAPRYDKDLDSLATIARERRKISISNSRYRGPKGEPTEYSLSKSVLFVWAGVHADQGWEEKELFIGSRKVLKGSYLQLHAVTQHQENPKIFRVK